MNKEKNGSVLGYALAVEREDLLRVDSPVRSAVIGIRQTEIIRENTEYVLNVVKIVLLLIANIVMIVLNGDERDIKQKSKTQSVLTLLD